MPQILDSQRFSTYVPRLIEVGNYFIINGLVHNKNSFKPNPLDYQIINTGPLASISTKQIGLVHSNDFNNDFNNSYIRDTEIKDNLNPNIIYKTFIKNSDSDVGIARFELTPATNSLKLIAYSSCSNFKTINIIGQNKDYIYIVGTRTIIDKAGIYRIRKTNMLFQDIAEERIVTGDWIPSKVLETDVYIYLLYNTTNNDMHLDILNKDSFTLSTIESSKLINDIGYFRQDLNTCIKVDKTIGTNYFNHEMYAIYGGAANTIKPAITGQINIGRFDFNTVNNVTSDMIEQVIDLSKQTDIVAMPIISINSEYRIHKVDYMSYNSEDYLIYTLLNNHKDNEKVEETTSSVEDHLTYLFKIKRSTNTLELVSATKHGDVFNVCLNINNGQTLILANKYIFKVLTLNTTTMRYVETYSYSIKIHMIGVDTLNRIHIASDLGVQYFTLTTPMEAKVYYEKEYYEFISSSSIETFIKVSTKDLLNRFRSSKVRISLKGPQVFKSNNSNIITINTSQDGETTIPIILKDEGFYDFVTEIIE